MDHTAMLRLTREQALEKFVEYRDKIAQMENDCKSLKAIILGETIPPRKAGVPRHERLNKTSNRTKNGMGVKVQLLVKTLTEYGEPMSRADLLTATGLERSLDWTLQAAKKYGLIHVDRTQGPTNYRYSAAVHSNSASQAH